jgi:hypothetical protein
MTISLPREYDDDPFKVITELQGVIFTDPEGNKRLGLSIDSLTRALPEAIFTYKDETIIDWSAVTVVATETLALLIERLDDLESKVDKILAKSEKID